MSLKLAFLPFTSFLALSAHAVFPIASPTASLPLPNTEMPIELVQSVPSETKLGDPSLRYAKDVWIELIQNAKTTLDIEQMYISYEAGKDLEPVINALKAAGTRGVKIRFILAKAMIGGDPTGLNLLKAIPNLVLSVIDLGSLTGGIQHAKFFVADRETVFVGSQNMDWKALSEIHELGVYLKSKNVAERLETVFETDLGIATTGKLPTAADRKTAPVTSTPGLEMVASPASINPIGINAALPTLLGLIQSAQKKIQIQVMDYSTYSFSGGGRWFDIDNALKAAAARGVQVELVVAHWNEAKPGINSIKELSLIPNITVRICEIPMKSTGPIPFARVIHSKFMVVDENTLWLSTSNWSQNYFTSTRNIDFVLKKPVLIKEALDIFDRVWTAPYTAPVDPKRDYPAPRKN